ncbi:hypothetical protein [Varibaculum cambriense]|uniref:hypothetical protein n=1 Tax=Varibaculum cambriense TaxID=184870 RepID=UPI002909CA68|nr:hypothetical protein [Varibaculum cambriense]MDU3273990.1 hypothetical protein [Varibaculum cambriense]
MLASSASSSAGKQGRLVLRLLVALVALVLIDLMLTLYLFVFSDGSGKLGVGLSKGKTPTVSTVIEVHKQIKSDAFTPYVAVESSPAVMVKESVDIWLIFITSEGANAQPLSEDGKVKGEPSSLPACDNGLAQPYEVFGGQIVCKGALGEKDNPASAAKNGDCAGEVIYRDNQVMVCASPSVKQAQTVSYLQKGKTIWKTSLQGKPALAANSKSIWATRITDKQGKVSYQRFDVPGAPNPGSEKPAGWDAIKKVDFQNITLTTITIGSTKYNDLPLSGGRWRETPDRDIGLALGIRQNDKVYGDINGDGYLDFAQVLYHQTFGGEIPERDEGELTFQGRVHQILVWIWDPQNQKPRLMEPKLIPPSNGPFCDGEVSGGNLFAADLSAVEGLGIKVKYLYSQASWSDVVVEGKDMEQLTQVSRSEEAEYRAVKDNLVRVLDGSYLAVMPLDACMHAGESNFVWNDVPDLLPFRGADPSLAVSPQRYKDSDYYWDAIWKDSQGNTLWYGFDGMHENYVLGWEK